MNNELHKMVVLYNFLDMVQFIKMKVQLLHYETKEKNEIQKSTDHFLIEKCDWNST